MLGIAYQRKNKDYFDKYGSYTTIDLAKTACSFDAKCGTVVDSMCDNTSPFALCPISALLFTSSRSCAYVKEGIIQIILVVGYQKYFGL